MKKFLAFCCCLLLTSCFEITERIKHHDDQSGEYTLMIDFSKSWFKTKSAIFLEEVDGPGKLHLVIDCGQILRVFVSTLKAEMRRFRNEAIEIIELRIGRTPAQYHFDLAIHAPGKIREDFQ